MPRPCKRRRVCAMPGCGRFGPVGAACGEAEAARVHMTVDEFEAIRLIDLENLTQEACAARMDVARTTAQAIYNSARRKLAQCLAYGRELEIDGGDYVICQGTADCSPCRGCCCREKQMDGDETA